MVSSSASSKVTVSVVPFAVAESNPGPAESAGVSLVTVLPEKSGTGSCALSASFNALLSGAA